MISAEKEDEKIEPTEPKKETHDDLLDISDEDGTEHEPPKEPEIEETTRTERKNQIGKNRS